MNICPALCPAQPWRTCAAIVMRTLRACFRDFALGGEILRIWSVAVALRAVMLRCERTLASEPTAARRVWTSRAAANSACCADAISAQIVTAVARPRTSPKRVPSQSMPNRRRECSRLLHYEQIGTVGMTGHRPCHALDLERRAYLANASLPGARWASGSLASLISFANCSCPPRGTWLGRKVTQSPTKGSLPWPNSPARRYDVTPRQASTNLNRTLTPRCGARAAP